MRETEIHFDRRERHTYRATVVFVTEGYALTDKVVESAVVRSIQGAKYLHVESLKSLDTQD